MKIRVDGEIKNKYAMNFIFNIRNVSLGMRRALYERLSVSMVTNEAEIWGMRMDERYQRDAVELRR